MNRPSTILQGSPKGASTTHATPLLPLTTQSLCPDCLTVINATIHQVDDEVYMDKCCPKHGPYRELISTDAKFFTLMLQRDRAHLRSVTNPLKGKQAPCPNGCGICSEHRSPPIMVSIDLTNRCNLNCPICFANANVRGEIVELTIDQVCQMLDSACNTDMVQPACLQYGGGEPTIHPQFLEALREANKRKFAQIQIATNGIKFAQDSALAAQASEAGLNIAYMQFDGMDDEVYRKTRGCNLVDIKLRAIDNLYQAGIRTVLVPTIVKGLNDNQIGKITNFAINNIDKITGISWQPVAFTGRINHHSRLAQRFTLADLAREIERQTGFAQMYRDWYPFCAADPFTRLIEAVEHTPQTALSCSPICGVATYLIVDPHQHKVFPLPAFVDVEPVMKSLAETAEQIKNKRFLRKLAVAQKLKDLRQFFHADRAPSGWTFETFLDFVTDFVDFRKRFNNNQARKKISAENPYKVLLMVSMHFQDVYNYQLDRVRRCVVHCVAPNGRLYPFCSYNCGPYHRSRVEKQFAIRLSEYHANTAKNNTLVPDRIG